MMDGNELFKWGGIIVVLLLVWHFVSGAFSGNGNQVQTSAWPGPYGIGGGVVTMTPYPAGYYWGPRTGRSPRSGKRWNAGR